MIPHRQFTYDLKWYFIPTVVLNRYFNFLVLLFHQVVRGVPRGLMEFIFPLQQAGLCKLSGQPTSNGYWTVYMGPHNNQGPVVSTSVQF